MDEAQVKVLEEESHAAPDDAGFELEQADGDG
jgi:hypothetical protein